MRWYRSVGMRGASPRVVISYSHGDWVMKGCWILCVGGVTTNTLLMEWKAGCIKLSSPVGASR